MASVDDYARTLRYWIIQSTTEAGSGHLTSSLSSVELMATLFFQGHFRYRVQEPAYANNDRLIFSKGHAAPLFYALWAMAGGCDYKSLLTLRQFGSIYEGHPTRRFPFTEVATGSLGQGLSVGVGMALNAQYLDKLPYRTWVLLGDSEMAEGSNWEAIQIAAHYKLSSLIGLIDVNGLGQRGETMYAGDCEAYRSRIAAFGWDAYVVDGHNAQELDDLYTSVCARDASDKPVMIIARTVKGKGIPMLEDNKEWHGKALNFFQRADVLANMGTCDENLKGVLAQPKEQLPKAYVPDKRDVTETDGSLSTRQAYGHALVKLHTHYPEMVVLDAEVSNSTYAKDFKDVYPERFFEMYIAEQNMLNVAMGLAARGKIPFVSTFASFFTRAVDQIRVAQYSEVNLNCVGSHAGVAIGEDGPTQMGLEDIAIFRAILNSVILYPADHVATEALVACMASEKGICYLRTTRADSEPIYEEGTEFRIGGSMCLRTSPKDEVTIVAAGVTLYEALQAYELLLEEGITVRVIDLYSIKPIDVDMLQRAARETRMIITVEDHFADGGIGDAVRQALSDRPVRVHSLAVRKMPRSGSAKKLLAYEEISTKCIVRKVMDVMKNI